MSFREDSGKERPGNGSHGILVLDDNPAECELMGVLLSQAGYRFAACGQAQQALELLAGGKYEVLLSDYHLGTADGLSVARQLREVHPGVFVILVTGDQDPSTAVGALRADVFDMVEKVSDLRTFNERLLATLHRALDPSQLTLSTGRLAARLLEHRRLLGGEIAGKWLIGTSLEIQRARSLAHRAAAERAPVLVVGETGTEKRAVAELIHERSGRRDLALEHFDFTARESDIGRVCELLRGHDARVGTCTSRL